MEDQKRITEQVSQNSSVIAQPSSSNGSKKGKKRPAETNAKMTDAASKDFGVEYAVSSRAECRGCENKIVKGEIRIKKTVYDTEVGMKYGGQPLWHHYECFAKVITLSKLVKPLWSLITRWTKILQLRSELGWFGPGNQLPGFKSLSKEDQVVVDKNLP